MELKQRTELRRLLIPELAQSLNILAMPLLELRNFVDAELDINPCIEEIQPNLNQSKTVSLEDAQKFAENLPPTDDHSMEYQNKYDNSNETDPDLGVINLVQKESLQEVLLRQLGMFTETNQDYIIGAEIIANIDENGYLKSSVDEISLTTKSPAADVERILGIIQKFDPPGIAARSISECLLIQIKQNKDHDPLIEVIIKNHLNDIARNNFGLIAKTLDQPQKTVETLIKKITALDPKPGRNFSLDPIDRVIPDVLMKNNDDEIEIIINNQRIPSITISKFYRDMLKQKNLDAKTKEFIISKLQKAMELIRAISRRQSSLQKVVDVIVEKQKEALQTGLSNLKPLAYQEVAQKIKMHESTVSRVVMNKYADTPYGIIPLKKFFSGSIQQYNGESVSSTSVKKVIADLIEQEDKKKPLSDQQIAKILAEKNSLKLSRRTVAKYREELRILASSYRKHH